jgi:hypothetical protein
MAITAANIHLLDGPRKPYRHEQHEADAIVIETNQGGDMAEETLRNAGFKGRIIRVHASKEVCARGADICVYKTEWQITVISTRWRTS